MGYLPVRISTLKQNTKLGFNIYIKLPHKILLYARSEDDIEDVRIKYLKKKKIRKLFIMDEDESAYQDYIDRRLGDAMEDASLNIDEKAELVVGAGEACAERIFEDPHSKKSYDSAKSTASNLINVLSKSDELLKGIFDATITSDNDTYDTRMQKHALNTSSLCISFAEFLEVPREWVELLGVAGLFHDIGYKDYSVEEQGLFFKSIEDMKAPELTRYKEHPKKGSEILQDKEFANPEVISLIMVHEEKRKGNGFPAKKTTLELQEEIICIAAYYDRQITCLKKTRDEVFEDFSINQLGNYDLEMIKKFKKFVKKAGL